MASGMNPRATAMKEMKKPAKELDHIRVAEAENGGTTTYLHHTDDYAHPPEGPHIFPKGEAVPVVKGHLFEHLAKKLNIPHEVIDGEKEVKEEEKPTTGEEDEGEE
jgi:hypothetical protein